MGGIGSIILGPIGDILGKIIDHFPDAKTRADLQVELAKLADGDAVREADNAIAQIEVDKVQAASASVFVSGARPALIWCGVLMIVWEAVLAPTVSRLFGGSFHMDTSLFQQVLWLVGGLCGVRGVETLLGVARSSLGPQPSTASPRVPLERDAPVLGQNAAAVRRRLRLG